MRYFDCTAFQVKSRFAPSNPAPHCSLDIVRLCVLATRETAPTTTRAVPVRFCRSRSSDTVPFRGFRPGLGEPRVVDVHIAVSSIGWRFDLGEMAAGRIRQRRLEPGWGCVACARNGCPSALPVNNARRPMACSRIDFPPVALLPVPASVAQSDCGNDRSRVGLAQELLTDFSVALALHNNRVGYCREAIWVNTPRRMRRPRQLARKVLINNEPGSPPGITDEKTPGVSARGLSSRLGLLDQYRKLRWRRNITL
jgi:hypothetical protein